ncbi:MAG: hypothetical protein WB507_09150 [Solirubrobacterales bacterium]
MISAPERSGGDAIYEEPSTRAELMFATEDAEPHSSVTSALGRARKRGAVVCVAIATGLLLTAAPAFAERSYDTQITGLVNPRGLAVNSAGDVWVSDSGSGLISKYDPYPSQTLLLSSQVAASGTLVLDNSENGDLYLTEGRGHTVNVYTNVGAFKEAWYPEPREGEGTTVAVDNSGTSSQGRVYLALTRDNYSHLGVAAFTSTHEPSDFSGNGSYISENRITGTPGNPSAFLEGGGDVISGIATDGKGNIYVAVERAGDAVDEFTAQGTFVQEIPVSNYPSAVAVDPTNGNILVALQLFGLSRGEEVIDEFSPSGEYIAQLPAEETPARSLGGEYEAEGDHIAVNSAGYVYYADSVNGVVDIFTPDVSLPTVAYLPASEETQTSGTLNATVAPNGGGEIDSCTFQYGTTSAYGQNVPCDPDTPYSGSTAVSANISHLTTETAYHYRVVLTNAKGFHRRGPDQTYIPHAVLGLHTDPATEVERTSATLNGSWTGNGEDTHYYFEWGPTEAYGNKSPLEDAGPSPQGEHVAKSLGLTKLIPETTYHYRLVAANSVGTTFGADREFATLPSVPNLDTDPATDVAPTSATLNGSWSGNGEDTHYYFEWGPTEAYGNTSPLEDAGPAPQGEHVAKTFELTGLEPITTYYYRILATNSVGTTIGRNRELTTLPAAPSLSASVGNVHSDSVVFRAQINPGGADTTYHFEYGLGSCSAHPDPCVSTPDEDAGSSVGVQNRNFKVTGLTPSTTYHYRLLAENRTGAVETADQTFTTFTSIPIESDPCPNAHVRQQTGAAQLLDCRGYELVSAANSGGYDVESDLVGGQAPYPGYPEAEHPPRVLYAVHDGGIPGTGHPTNRGPDPYVATRGEDGWSTEYLGIPADNPFSKGLFSSITSAADASLDTLAFGGPGGCSPCFEGGYTGIPVHLPNGQLVQGMVGAPGFEPGPSASPDGHIATDLSANGEHFIFGSTSQFAAGGDNETGDVSIYDHNLKTGETHVVSDAPGGGPLPCLQGKGQCSAAHHDSNGISELAISRDGSHILLGQKVSTDADGNVYWHLYMDVNDLVKSIDLTPGLIAEAGGSGFAEGVLFDGMTEDGSRVFFTTADPLPTATNPDTDTSADIYAAEISGESATLTRISTGTEGTGNTDACHPLGNWNTVSGGPNCNAVAIAGGGGVASKSGAIYFLSPEQLAGASHGTQGLPNLYLARPGSPPQFVSTIDSSSGKSPPPPYHHLSGTFGSFSGPTFVAVDNSGRPPSGDVYVGNGTAVYKFDSSGHPIKTWAEEGQLKTAGTEGVAVNSSGTLYVLAGGQVREFSKNGTESGGFAVGGSSMPLGIAVDPAGNVYLASNDEEHGPGDVTLNQFPHGAAVTAGLYGYEVVTHVPVTGFATNPVTGELYVDIGGLHGHVDRFSFNPAGEVIEPHSRTCSLASFANTPPCNPSGTFVAGLSGATGIGVDPTGQDVYLDEGNQIEQFDTAAKPATTKWTGANIAGSTAIAVSASGELYATTSNGGQEEIAHYTVEPAPFNPINNPAVLHAVQQAEIPDPADFQVTPDGNYAVFTSPVPLTAYDGNGHSELYRYDASSERLDCVSCDPTNAEAAGDATLARDGLSLTDRGQVFFNSTDSLAPRDLDENEDVYEWEPQGTGTCNAENPNFSKSSETCLGLISTGTSPFGSSLLGASADGTDAYFFTRDTLVPQDQNGELVKLYDARVEGGFPYTPTPPLCKASDECHGPGSQEPGLPPIHTTAVAGEGNTPPLSPGCRAGHVKRHGRCIPRHHKSNRHPPKPHRRGRAINGRRGGGR